MKKEYHSRIPIDDKIYRISYYLGIETIGWPGLVFKIDSVNKSVMYLYLLCICLTWLGSVLVPGSCQGSSYPSLIIGAEGGGALKHTDRN